MKSSAAMTSVRAAQTAAFKNCCLRSGRYDGKPRNYFFPRVAVNSGSPTYLLSQPTTGQSPALHFCGPINVGSLIENDPTPR